MIHSERAASLLGFQVSVKPKKTVSNQMLHTKSLGKNSRRATGGKEVVRISVLLPKAF